MSKIPKIIHFCWLSGEKYPSLIEKCIESWHKIMPDYEIICWDKQRFDCESVPFVKEACSVKKWAFAADYIRLYALYNYGGIYLDSDVYAFKRLDKFLDYRVFSGIEYCLSSASFTCHIEAAIIGAEKANPYIKKCLEYYENRPFILPDGTFDQTICPKILADTASRYYGFEKLPRQQLLRGDICICAPEVFAHAYIETCSLKNTYAIHLCEGGWYKKEENIPAVKKMCKRGASLFRRFGSHPYKTLWMLYWHYKLGKIFK